MDETLSMGAQAGASKCQGEGRRTGGGADETGHVSSILRGAGMVKRVRGIAYSMRVAPAASNRMVDGARGVLNPLLADVFVFTDHMPGHEAGESPGYGLSLVAETTTGLLISSQASAPPAVKVRNSPVRQAHRTRCDSRGHHPWDIPIPVVTPCYWYLWVLVT